MSMRSALVAGVVAVGLGSPGAAPGQGVPDTVPLAHLEPLTAATWEAAGEGFSTTLAYRWALPGRVLEATNEIRDGEGRVTGRYHGTYVWHPGREEIVFRTVSEGGELHEGRAWWKDGVLWHEATVSGGAITAYASALRPAEGRVEYFAAYGVDRVPAGLLETEPLVYRPARD